MRTLAIFLSPLVGVTLMWFAVMIFTESPEYGLITIMYFVAYFVALMVQVFVEVIILVVESWGKITFKFYFSIAFFSCVGIGLVTFLFQDYSNFYKNFSASVGAFLFFFAYSIGNCIVYNYLYFSKLTQNKI
jgi:hypothetical protein